MCRCTYIHLYNNNRPTGELTWPPPWTPQHSQQRRAYNVVSSSHHHNERGRGVAGALSKQYTTFERTNELFVISELSWAVWRPPRLSNVSDEQIRCFVLLMRKSFLSTLHPKKLQYVKPMSFWNYPPPNHPLDWLYPFVGGNRRRLCCDKRIFRWELLNINKQ